MYVRGKGLRVCVKIDLGGNWESPAPVAVSQEAAEPVLVLPQAVCSSASPGTRAASCVASYKWLGDCRPPISMQLVMLKASVGTMVLAKCYLVLWPVAS